MLRTPLPVRTFVPATCGYLDIQVSICYPDVVARKRSKRKHSVRADVQIMELSKSGTSIQLEIFAQGEKIGQLVIGRGSMTWYGRKWHKGRRFSWPRFAAKMDE